MDNINISNIFPDKNINLTNKILDVTSLYELRQKETNFNVESLLIKKDEKRKKLNNKYKKLFELCLRKIKEVNKSDVTDIIYTIPQYIYNLPEYNSIDCLMNIEDELRKMNLDTLILSNIAIFVSWHNLEDNIKK